MFLSINSVQNIEHNVHKKIKKDKKVKITTVFGSTLVIWSVTTVP